MGDVTLILDAIQRGDRQATERLIPLVYDELRRLAASRLAKEAANQTLQATELVHEALGQLAGVDAQAAELVKLRFFAGLTRTQIAEVFGVSRRTADNLWAFAKARLYRALGEDQDA